MSWTGCVRCWACPDAFKGMICDTASMSTFHALAAAREGVLAFPDDSVRDDGICGPDAPVLRIYASEQAHSSVEKSAMALGIGRRGLAKIGRTPNSGWMLVRWSRRSRRTCAKVCGHLRLWPRWERRPRRVLIPSRGLRMCARNTICGCMSMRLTPGRPRSFRSCGTSLTDAIARIRSWSNPHKWLLTPMDLSAFYCRRPEMLQRAFSLTPDYLKTAEGDSVTNTMDYTLQLGRRFRALKLWMIVRHYGVRACRLVIREHIRLARLFASLVESDSRFEIVAPVLFSTVCFRLKTGDADNSAR